MIDKPKSRTFLRRFVPLLCAVPVALAAAPSGEDPLVGYYRMWERALPLDGAAVTSPPLPAGPAGQYRVLVRGTLDTGSLGFRFDARFFAAAEDQLRLPHEHLVLEPDLLALHHERRAEHRYVYALTRDLGATTAIRFRWRGMGRRLQLGNAKLREVTRGAILVSVWRRGPAPPSRPWALWAGLAGGLLLVGISIAIVLGRRRRRGSAPPRQDPDAPAST